MFFRHLTDVEEQGRAPGPVFLHHGPGVEMRIQLGSERRRIAAHEVFALGVGKTRAQRQKHGLPFPAEFCRHVPDLEEFKIAQPGTRAQGHAEAFARAGIGAVAGLPARIARGYDERLGLDDIKLRTARMEPRKTGKAAVFHENVRNLYAGKQASLRFFQFRHEMLNKAFASGAERAGKNAADMFQPSLADASEFSVVIQSKPVSHLFIFPHALQGTLHQTFEHVLFNQPLEVIGQLFHPVFHIVFRIPYYHVAAAHGALTAALERALVNDHDMSGVPRGLQRGPQSGHAAAENKNVRLKNMPQFIKRAVYHSKFSTS